MNDIQREVSEKTEEFNASASALLVESQSIQVADEESAGIATSFLSDVKDRLKEIEGARTQIVKPINDSVKKINDGFKKAKLPLQEAEKTVKAALSKYQQEKIKKEQEERRKAEREAEKERQAAMEKAKEEGTSEIVAAAKVEKREVKVPKTMIQTGNAKAVFRTIWKFRITDASKVPSQYLVVNESQIGKDVRSGAREIPGVEIYSEQNVVV